MVGIDKITSNPNIYESLMKDLLKVKVMSDYMLINNIKLDILQKNCPTCPTHPTLDK